jgi:amino acid adenylation domain-containing protein/thioester reductase-like protein
MNNMQQAHLALPQQALDSSLAETHLIVVNNEGQHSIWPAGLAVPAGWRPEGQAMRKDACLAVIAAQWPDIVPVSIRDAGRAGPRRDAADPDAADPDALHPDALHPGGGIRQAPRRYAPRRYAPRHYALGRGDGPRYVHEAFDEQASRQPDSAAVVSATGKLTYRQLSESANQLAHYLQGRGVAPETLVGVGMERGAETIRCLLAVLKAGGAYLPLDPSLPAIRLAQMREEAGIRFVLTHSSNTRALAGGDGLLLPVDTLAAEIASHPVSAPVVSLRPANLAYAIWTSGSTGHPKAVAVSHASLARLGQDVIREYGLTAADRVLQLASLGFDTSLEQIFGALLSGAALMLPAAGPVAPSDLVRYLAQERVSVADLTPAYWHQILAAAGEGGKAGEAGKAGPLGSLRLMITGGDHANAADCRAALRKVPGARLINAYGLTETTITSALFEATEELLPSDLPPSDLPPSEVLRSGLGAPVPVGKPLPLTQILVLDEDLKPRPAGVAGEIYIGGPGVARGYLGRPELTAELFMPNPHAAVPGARMYRTGDLGRWRQDQNLEVIGRVDRQVKVRGYRVEPAEIEGVLAGRPDIDQVAVTVHDLGGGDKRIAAYYTLQPGRGTPRPPSAESLRRHLSARLPSFMIPAVFVPLDRMPLTPAGEVDRTALALPAAGTGAHPAAAHPGAAHPDGVLSTPLQAGMRHLWAQVLSVPQVSLDDDFFRLGGNSLLAAEMLARARVMFGVDARQVRPLTRCLLRDPTLRGFAEAAKQARAGTLASDGADARVDFTREAALDVPIRADGGPPPRWPQPAAILLTGATGFFGVHLLRELLACTGARVHCLVRAHDADHGLDRIAQAAERYELGSLALDRVIALPGDLAKPDLGLPRGTFDELARRIDVIHHAGALVNFIYPYSELRAPNVTATRELIRLAGLYRSIPVHYVSTAAVLAGFGRAGIREVSEDTPLAYAEYLSVGYVESNFVAEEMLRNAARHGLPVSIYRPLDIVGDSRGGVWNTSTEMCALIRLITDTGIAPDIDLPLDFAPADICAAAIGYIATHVTAAGKTYHLASPKHALLASLTDRLRKFGFTINEIPYQEWVDKLLRYAAAHPSHPMTPFVPLFVDRSPGSDITVAEMYLDHIFPAYSRDNTERALRGSGIAFPPVDENLLDLHIARLVGAGYLKDPRNGHPGNLALSNREAPHGSQLSPGLGVTRRVAVPRRLSCRLLRGSEPGERAGRLPAGHNPVPRAR